MALASTLQWQHPQRVGRGTSSVLPDTVDDGLAMIATDDAGHIKDCSRGCEDIFGYRQHELSGRHVSTLLPQLADTELVQEDRVHPRLAFLCRCAMPFDARHRDGRRFSSELFINRLDRHNIVVLVRKLERAAA